MRGNLEPSEYVSLLISMYTEPHCIPVVSLWKF